MKKFESAVHTIPFPQESVFSKLADLTHLEDFRSRIQSPEYVQTFCQKNDSISEEQLKTILTFIEKVELTTDAITIPDTPFGTVALQVVEREEPKCIKFETVNSPVKGNIWVQILPTSPYESKIKCTIGAELNFITEQMAKKPLSQSVEQLASMLSQIPYGY